MYTRQSWKFAAENRITGTPSFWINGVETMPPYDDADWNDFIDTYVKPVVSEKSS